MIHADFLPIQSLSIKPAFPRSDLQFIPIQEVPVGFSPSPAGPDLGFDFFKPLDMKQIFPKSEKDALTLMHLRNIDIGI